MKKAQFVVALALLAALVGLVVSSLLLVDYVRPLPVFCEESGCDAVKHTIFARPLGVPLPGFGMVSFAALAALAVLRGVWVRRVSLAVAAGMGLFAALLLGVQKLMGSYCPFCVVTDVAAIVSLFAVAARVWTSADLPKNKLLSISSGVVTALAMIIPVGVGFAKQPKPPVPMGLPDPIAKEIANTPIGQVSVVDFVDFECPFCRATHAAMEPVRAKHRSQLRIVRKQVPLRMHPHARTAAKAACCAEELGHGEEFAQALFSTPVEQLTGDGCETLAKSMGMDADKYRDCVRSARIEDRLKADTDTFKAVQGHGLPTIWVHDEELKGEQSTEELEDAVTRALVRRGS